MYLSSLWRLPLLPIHCTVIERAALSEDKLRVIVKCRFEQQLLEVRWKRYSPLENRPYPHILNTVLQGQSIIVAGIMEGLIAYEQFRTKRIITIGVIQASSITSSEFNMFDDGCTLSIVRPYFTPRARALKAVADLWSSEVALRNFAGTLSPAIKKSVSDFLGMVHEDDKTSSSPDKPQHTSKLQEGVSEARKRPVKGSPKGDGLGMVHEDDNISFSPDMSQYISKQQEGVSEARKRPVRGSPKGDDLGRLSNTPAVTFNLSQSQGNVGRGTDSDANSGKKTTSKVG
ncbi:hypothetical protein BGX26_007333 [Mortierella sp. AD094]|nr:hypothetical protein BGX26_007333 [Mortierella sp. AD094]